MKVYRNPLLKMQQSLWSLLLGGGSTQGIFIIHSSPHLKMIFRTSRNRWDMKTRSLEGTIVLSSWSVFFWPNPETAKNQWLEPEEFQRSCFYVRFTLGGGNSHEVYGILIILTLRTCFENPNPNIQCKQ